MFLRKIFRFFIIVLTPILLFFFLIGYHELTGGFHLRKIQKNLHLGQELSENQPFTDKLSHILNQPFTYFAKGNQAYVFCSQDGKFVLKILRHHKYETPFWARLFPDSKRAKKWHLHRENSYSQAFMSYEITANAFLDLTQVIFSHLNPTNNHHGSLVLKDLFGRKWEIDLDRTSYFIQRRGDTIFSDALLAKKKDKDVEGAKRIIASFLDVVTALADHGVYTRPKNCFFNLGVMQEKVQIYDLGAFRMLDNENHTKEKVLLAYKEELKRWCKIHYPEMISCMDP